MTHPLAVESGPPPVDPRPRRLLEKYCSLTGALLLDIGDGLLQFDVPPGERHHWGRQRSVKVALHPEALAEDPEAELLGIGSPVFGRLLIAIRGRGYSCDFGLVAPEHEPATQESALPVPAEGAEVRGARSELSLLPIGRLLVRVSIKAGAALREHLVESPPVDLSTGARVPEGLVAVLVAPSPQSPPLEPPAEAVPVPRRPMAELLPRVFDELETELREELERVGREAEQALRQELHRLDRYYGAFLAEVESEASPDAADKKRAIQAEHARRRSEEEERARTRITVHPIQLLQWRVLAQRVAWSLATPSGVSAELGAARLLTGDPEWRLACPSCGRRPGAVWICRAGHVACPDCSGRCGVCGEAACAAHGLAECGFGGHQVCAEHRLVCGPCGRVHCPEHAVRCDTGDHDVCPACAVACAICGAATCRQHGVETGPQAPRGHRWLCRSCAVLCEESQTEPVGKDEAVRCSACERYVCEHHRVACAVDGAVHCSRHLRRSDRSGRLACEAHRAACDDEPGAILASDEVEGCGTCGRRICDRHGAPCLEDGRRHCAGHLGPVRDRPGQQACERHRTICHVDGVAFSLAGTRPCAVCDKAVCEEHRVACPSCGRQVCRPDFEVSRCVTCGHLAPATDPPEELIQAALAANPGQPVKAKGWRTARDASGTVVELDLGWTRRLVFSVLHGDTKPKTVVQHSLLGSKRRR